MSLDTAVVFVMLIAVALSPFILVFQITRLAHSAFRNKLWAIRDGLVDDLRLGRIQRSESAEQLLEIVQMHIDIAGRHTFADTLLGVAIYRSNSTASIYEEILGTAVPPADRERLIEYLRHLRDASINHLALASPTGWVAIPLIRLVVRLRRASLQRQDQMSQRQIREQIREQALRNEAERVELQVMPKLMPKVSTRLDVEERSVLLTEVPC